MRVFRVCPHRQKILGTAVLIAVNVLIDSPHSTVLEACAKPSAIQHILQFLFASVIR